MKHIKTKTQASISQPFDAPAVPVPLDTGSVNRKLQNKAVFISALSNVHLPQYANNVFYFNLGVSPYFKKHDQLAEVMAALSESYPGVPLTARQRGLVVTPMILRNTETAGTFNADDNPALAEVRRALEASGFVVGKL